MKDECLWELIPSSDGYYYCYKPIMSDRYYGRKPRIMKDRYRKRGKDGRFTR